MVQGCTSQHIISGAGRCRVCRHPSVPMENGEILMELQGWFGNYFLIDHDALQGNKPKFKIIIDPWLALMAKYDPYVQSCVPIWHAALPQAVSLPVDVVLGD